MARKRDAKSWKHGLEVVDQVYGAGYSATMDGHEASPFVSEVVNHVFGEIWSRPGLTIAQRRLLVIGATTMLGRADLIEVQIGGAIANGELTDEQLGEIPLMMLCYAGAGNTTALLRGIEAAKQAAKAKQAK
jgi:4-carboxymuconolactone decarboxylase